MWKILSGRRAGTKSRAEVIRDVHAFALGTRGAFYHDLIEDGRAAEESGAKGLVLNFLLTIRILYPAA
jgi:hypothetical protein